MIRKIGYLTLLTLSLHTSPVWAMDSLEERSSSSPDLSREQKRGRIQIFVQQLRTFGITNINQYQIINAGVLDLSSELISLTDEQKQTILTSMCDLTWLTQLTLDRNKLSTLPDAMGKLTKLKNLYINYNNFQTIPEALRPLTQLEILYFFNNKIQEVPEWIGTMSTLQEFSLSYNPLQTMPSSIGSIHTLRLLNLKRTPHLLSQGTSEHTWGQAELLNHFKDRVHLNEHTSSSSSFLTGEIVWANGLSEKVRHTPMDPPPLVQETTVRPPTPRSRTSSRPNFSPPLVQETTVRPPTPRSRTSSRPNFSPPLVQETTVRPPTPRTHNSPQSTFSPPSPRHIIDPSPSIDLVPENHPPLDRLDKWEKRERVTAFQSLLQTLNITHVDTTEIITENRLRLPGKLKHLSEEQKQRVIQKISQLDWLESLHLNKNELSHLPDCFSNLSQLRYLQLSNNAFETLPEALKSLSKLEELCLTRNQIHTLPDWINCFSNLQMLLLADNLFLTVPASIGSIMTLSQIHLMGLPFLLPQGDSEYSWGRQELMQQFGDRVQFDDEAYTLPMPADTTEEKVCSFLDRQLLSINRPLFHNTKLPDIQVQEIFSGHEMLDALSQIVQSLNLENEKELGYQTFELLANDFSSDAKDSTLCNRDKVITFLLPRLTGYVKCLYGLPLNEKEVRPWMMYPAHIPETQKVLTFILSNMHRQFDPELKSIWFLQLVNGLLHCPTGQSEALNTVAYGMLEGKYQNKEFISIVEQILAVKKNSAFTQVILTKTSNNSQNVHTVSLYRDKLKDYLGLTSAIQAYTEHMVSRTHDAFSTNIWNVVKVFYDLVTPGRLVHWIAGASQTMDDRTDWEMMEKIEKILNQASQSSLKDRVANLESRLLNPSLTPTQRQQLTAILEASKKQLALQKPVVIPVLEILTYFVERQLIIPTSSEWQPWFGENASPESFPCLSGNHQLKLLQIIKARIRHNSQFRPLSVGDTVRYLVDVKIVDFENENWWKGFFTSNPEKNGKAVLTPEGVHKILIHRGFIIEKKECS